VGGKTVGEPSVAALLDRLRSADAQSAWRDFLQEYNPILYQTARACTRDEDEAADCFLYICEQLAKKSFHRLLLFRPDGAASFGTWLRVVARNLCVDCRRKKHGRPRPFKSVQNLSRLELEVYRCRCERGLSQQQTLEEIRAIGPGVSLSELNDIESRIENFLSPRQHWILSARNQSRSNATTLVAGQEGGENTVDVVDTGPNQETIILEQQLQAKVQECVGSLPRDERLIVQLRFEEGLSLEEISRVTGLGGPQRVHRRLAAVLQKLRAAISQSNNRKIGDYVRKVTQEAK
jgi:RNA polymerase sigma factor (sigma-70 family)